MAPFQLIKKAGNKDKSGYRRDTFLKIFFNHLTKNKQPRRALAKPEFGSSDYLENSNSMQFQAAVEIWRLDAPYLMNDIELGMYHNKMNRTQNMANQSKSAHIIYTYMHL